LPGNAIVRSKEINLSTPEFLQAQRTQFFKTLHSDQAYDSPLLMGLFLIRMRQDIAWMHETGKLLPDLVREWLQIEDE
jgi:hypothetical protein